MGRIIVSENVSLDGVAQDPTGEEGFARGGWFLRMGDRDRAAWAENELADALGAAALLLGRRTDAVFGARWTPRSGAWADRLNSLPKYVVSSNLPEPIWSNVTVLGGQVVPAVEALKREVDGDILVYASLTLVHTLMEHDLVDEVRLTVHPIVVGAGRRLFGETGAARPLYLVGARTVGDSLVVLTHARHPGPATPQDPNGG